MIKAQAKPQNVVKVTKGASYRGSDNNVYVSTFVSKCGSKLTAMCLKDEKPYNFNYDDKSKSFIKENSKIKLNPMGFAINMIGL